MDHEFDDMDCEYTQEELGSRQGGQAPFGLDCSSEISLLVSSKSLETNTYTLIRRYQ